jgi:hypothetical protein
LVVGIQKNCDFYMNFSRWRTWCLPKSWANTWLGDWIGVSRRWQSQWRINSLMGLQGLKWSGRRCHYPWPP